MWSLPSSRQDLITSSFFAEIVAQDYLRTRCDRIDKHGPMLIDTTLNLSSISLLARLLFVCKKDCYGRSRGCHFSSKFSAVAGNLVATLCTDLGSGGHPPIRTLPTRTSTTRTEQDYKGWASKLSDTSIVHCQCGITDKSLEYYSTAASSGWAPTVAAVIMPRQSTSLR